MITITQRAHRSRTIPHFKRTKRAFMVLTVQTVRQFTTLEKASNYINHRAHQSECYVLHQTQTAPERWTVSRVLGGAS